MLGFVIVHNDNPFFTDAARLLLYGVMVGLLDRKNWSLRDLLMICRDLPRLKDMLLRSPYTADFVPLLLSVEKQSATIMTTLATKLLPFETVAALWDRALAEGRVVSLNDWVKSNFILVLGTHPANRAALQTLNQVIFRRVADLLLTQAEEKDHGVTGRKTWLILDEVREAGKLDGLTSLLNQGRSKAVCMVLGFQDVEGMRHVYGKEEAHEIFGMCDNKTMLRTESQPTAEWVEKHFGQALVSEITTSQSESTSGEYTSSENVQEHIQLRSTVLAAEIMGLPKTNPQNGMTAYHDIPQFGPYKATLPWSTITDLRRQMIPGRLAPTGEILGEMPRSVQDQYLRPWGEADAKLLAKPVATEVSTPASEEKRILSALSLSPDSPTTNPPE